MFIQMRRFTVTEGSAHHVIEKFSKGDSPVSKQEGFIDLTVMEKKVRRGNEEVLVMVRWASEAHWKAWEKSPEHIAGHRAQKGQEKPEYIISVEVAAYEVR